jgi:hypothetical protein
MSATATYPPVNTPAPARADQSGWLTGVLWVQGLYYLVTGVWPLVSMDTFLAITGPKTDLWLVDTVGVLIAVIALALLLAAVRRHAPAEVVLLALASAVALAGVDVIFTSLRVIPPVYLLDAVAEVVLIAWWLLALAVAGSRRGA